MSEPVTGSDYCKCFISAAASSGQTTLLVTNPTEPFPTFDLDHTYFYLTIVDAASYAIDAIPPAQREIVKVTAYIVSGSGYELTVDRGITTTAQTWAVGAVCEIRPCEQWFEDLKGAGTTIDASYATVNDESLSLPNSRQLVAGSNIVLTDGGAGSTLTIASTGGGGMVQAQYVTMATNAGLDAERVLTAGSGISVTDGGANSTVTVANTALGESYVVIGTTSLLTADRVLTAGTGISITDGGANSTVTIAATGGAGGSSQSQEFTTPGAFTFDVPAGVSLVRVTAIGAGGGGAGRGAGSTVGAGGGGSGELMIDMPIHVTPEGTLTGSVGAKGVGGTGGSNPGSNGGDTTVGIFTLIGGVASAGQAGGVGGGPRGGLGGVSGSNPTQVPGTAESPVHFGGSGGGGGGIAGNNGGAGAPAGGYTVGGAAGANSSGHAGGGGGGGSLWGPGGAGGAGDAAGSNAPANAYGAGGGGAGANTAQSGGDGQNGYVLIEWVA